MIGTTAPPDGGPLWAVPLCGLVLLVIVFGPMLWYAWADKRTERRVRADRRKYGPGPR